MRNQFRRFCSETSLNVSLDQVDNEELDEQLLSDSDLERRQLQMENERLLHELEEAHERIRILQNKNPLTTSSEKKRRGKWKFLPRLSERFRRNDKDSSTSDPEPQQTDARSVAAVCDVNEEIGFECLQLEFASLSNPTKLGTHKSLATKYLQSPGGASCDVTEASSLAEV